MGLPLALAGILLLTATPSPAPSVQPWVGDPADGPAGRVLAVAPRVLDVGPRAEDGGQPVPERESITVGADVLFAFGSADLPASAAGQLAGIGARIGRGHPTAIRVEGHTDGIGDDAANQSLSERRAAAVAAALSAAAAGVPVQQEGFGETRPLRPETTASGEDDPAARAANRRVTVVLRD